MSIVERIQALIARAGSDHEEEARTSAVIACRLIREHKIVLSEESAAPPASIFGGGVDGAGLEDLASQAFDFLERLQRRRGAAQAQARGYARGSTNTNARPRYPDPAPRNVYPFDPFAAPFETVRAFVKTRGIDVHDNGDGSFSAHVGHHRYRGAWPDMVRFMFTMIESGKASRAED